MMVIGVGNRWRRDDAAGLELARRLRPLAPPGTRVLAFEGEPSGLLGAWSGEREVVLVDAVGSGAAPGTIHRFDGSSGPLPARLFRASTHHLGVADAVELARSLGRLPERLEVYGIEGSSFAAGQGLSVAVEHAVAKLTLELSERHPPVSSSPSRNQ